MNYRAVGAGIKRMAVVLSCVAAFGVVPGDEPPIAVQEQDSDVGLLVTPRRAVTQPSVPTHGFAFTRIDVPGSTQTVAMGINNWGKIVGNYRFGSRGTPATFEWHVVFFDNCTTRSYGSLTYFGVANN